MAVISALYAKFLIVMGLAFPMTEVISNHVTSSSYLVGLQLDNALLFSLLTDIFYPFEQGFYLYLYFGCIAYFLYVFITVLRKKAVKGNNSCKTLLVNNMCYRVGRFLLRQFQVFFLVRAGHKSLERARFTSSNLFTLPKLLREFQKDPSVTGTHRFLLDIKAL